MEIPDSDKNEGIYVLDKIKWLIDSVLTV